MIGLRDIVSVDLTREEFDLARRNADKACLNGRSYVRETRDRERRLRTDQFVGQLSELAGHKFIYGTIEGYVTQRTIRNAAPYSGDGGSDTQDGLIDFKGSLMRNPELTPMQYRLAVRPAERHQGKIYVLCLVPRPARHIHLVGWMPEKFLPVAPEERGVFHGAFTLKAHRLRSMTALRDFLDQRSTYRHAV